MHTVPDERPPWWRRLADFATDHDFLTGVVVAFAVYTAASAAGYVAGYRDGAGECSR